MGAPATLELPVAPPSPSTAPRASDARAAARRAAPLVGDDVLASLLVRHQVAPERDVERCFEEALAAGTFLEERVIAAGLASAATLRRLLEDHFFCPALDLAAGSPDADTVRLLPPALALRHLLLPWRVEGDALRVVMAQPDRTRLRDVVARTCGLRVLPAVALRHELWRAIETAYGRAPSIEAGRTPTLTPDDVAPARTHVAAAAVLPAVPAAPAAPAAPMAPQRRSVTVSDGVGADAAGMVDAMLRQAVENGATDVHVEPGETELIVRVRIDGMLVTAARLPVAAMSSVTSRLKVLAGMDITERRAPQDGRATFRVADELLDVRASSLPSRHGETIVLRLLRRDSGLLRVKGLQLPDDVAARHREMVEAPMGLFLVTGPTGSGKTTTLYATLNAIDRNVLSVVTLEDPIEYALDGVTQSQINEPAGLTFASGLKSILRQDPDVILVGEIREAETAEIACKAALTGHKVLSSLHANDACQAVTRLADMGVPRDLIAATLRGVIAQRLLRRPCRECRESRPPTDVERCILGASAPESVWTGPGCAGCGRTGYKGRLAVFEYFGLTQALQRMVLDRASGGALKQAARRTGMRTMLDAGRRAVADGDTTIAELHRVLLSEEGSEATCPRCARAVAPEFTSCPYCMHSLREACRACGSAVEDGWRACAACGAPRADRREAPQCRRCAAPLESHWSSCPYCLESSP